MAGAKRSAKRLALSLGSGAATGAAAAALALAGAAWDVFEAWQIDMPRQELSLEVVRLAALAGDRERVAQVVSHLERVAQVTGRERFVLDHECARWSATLRCWATASRRTVSSATTTSPRYSGGTSAARLRDAQVLRGWLRRRWLARILEKTKLDLLNALLISRGQLLGLLVDASRLDERSQIRKIGVDVIVAGGGADIFADEDLARAGNVCMAGRVGDDDLAYLQYTGGTTGVPKGAMLTHGNIVANLQQAHAWISSYVKEGVEVIITALPLYHIFSLTANCLTFFKIGACNVLITNPRDIPGFVAELGKYPFTVITGVNTLFNALLNHPDFEKLDFSSLRLALGGGMAVQQAVAERWKAVTGRPLAEAYGLTETSPAVCINPLDLPAFNHSIGLPISSTEISLRDDEGYEVPVGEPGELCVKGPQVMKGYYNRPEDTARVFTRDGFLRTGDVAVIAPDGYVRIVDRKKDMILVSGFNVYPNEVEDVVASHPGVLEVAALGVPDERSGEAVKIFVVRKDPTLTAEALIAHCRQGLTGYKVPHYVEFRDELPKSNVGKILRRALRDAGAAKT